MLAPAMPATGRCQPVAGWLQKLSMTYWVLRVWLRGNVLEVSWDKKYRAVGTALLRIATQIYHDVRLILEGQG